MAALRRQKEQPRSCPGSGRHRRLKTYASVLLPVLMLGWHTARRLHSCAVLMTDQRCSLCDVLMTTWRCSLCDVLITTWKCSLCDGLLDVEKQNRSVHIWRSWVSLCWGLPLRQICTCLVLSKIKAWFW